MGLPNILIVDDEECIRDFLCLALCEKANITEASDGSEAFEKAQQKHFDLIISDIQMPHLNGMDLYEKLLSIDPEVMRKFVFCTGYVTDIVHTFISENQLRLCKKPIVLQTLNSLVKEMLP